MCGIFGIVQADADRPPAEHKLAETARIMRHRGPDGWGTFRDTGIGLVHTRLSLVDLSDRSNQPFWDASRRYCLVYNGELYDFIDLRRKLAGEGVVFRTTSDTEVLLASLITWGVESTLDRIDGMFAFGFYDTQTKQLVLARDRVGIKPLYVYSDSQQLLFASHPTAMSPWIELRPDRLTISSYLQGWGGPTIGQSFFESVQIVPPGTVIRVNADAKAEFSQYFHMSDLADPEQAAELQRANRADLVDKVEERLLASVQAQLCADAPLGALCSGGVDSSLVTAMAKRFRPDLTVFHADVVGPLSERDAAQQLAAHLDLPFQSVAVEDRHLIESMPEIIEHYGFPFSRLPNAVPFYHVSRLVRENGVKAVLCGEGADECYLGYPRFAPNIRAMIRQLPGRLYRETAVRLREWKHRRRGEGGRMSLSSNDRELACNLQTRFEFELGIPAFNEKQITGSRTARSARSLHESGELTYILRMLLHRNDSLGMASSIESRFPFLDRQLLQLAVNLPLDCKLRFSPRVLEREHLFFRDKWIIRKIAERYLPSVLSKRKKRGFPTSAQKRLHIADSYWQDSFIQDLFGLSHARMQFVVSEASHAFKNRLLQLDLWGKLFFQRVAKSELADQLAASTRVLTGRETFPSNSSDAFPGASCRTVPSYSARGHNEKRAA